MDRLDRFPQLVEIFGVGLVEPGQQPLGQVGHFGPRPIAQLKGRRDIVGLLDGLAILAVLCDQCGPDFICLLQRCRGTDQQLVFRQPQPPVRFVDELLDGIVDPFVARCGGLLGQASRGRGEPDVSGGGTGVPIQVAKEHPQKVHLQHVDFRLGLGGIDERKQFGQLLWRDFFRRDWPRVFAPLVPTHGRRGQITVGPLRIGFGPVVRLIGYGFVCGFLRPVRAGRFAVITKVLPSSELERWLLILNFPPGVNVRQLLAASTTSCSTSTSSMRILV